MPRSFFTIGVQAVGLLLCVTAAAVSQLPTAAATRIPRPVPNGLIVNCTQPFTRLVQKTVNFGPQDICADFAIASPNPVMCTVLGILNDVSKKVNGECRPHKQAPSRNISATGEAIPKPLRDRRPLPPAAFADDVLQEEAATHYWYITNVINLFLWAPCKALDSFTTTYLIPDGWSLLHMENTPPQGPYKAPIPACAVLKSADGKQLAVIIRGTRTAEEWQVDLTYVQTDSDPTYPGKVSVGFLFGAALLWPALEGVLQKEVVQGGVTSVTVAGHSLGAAVGTLLSYQAQVYLDEHLAAANKQPVAVGALLFAAPNVGDDAFVAEYNMKVNARRISFIYDMIPQVPCAPTMMACKGTDFLTALPGVRSWNYGKVGGQITLTPAGMPLQPDVWNRTEAINGCMVIPWALATHICSYTCYYSKAAGAEQDGRCRLWGEANERVGTEFCIGYPFTDPEFPLAEQGAGLVIGSKPPDRTKPFEVIISGRR